MTDDTAVIAKLMNLVSVSEPGTQASSARSSTSATGLNPSSASLTQTSGAQHSAEAVNDAAVRELHARAAQPVAVSTQHSAAQRQADGESSQQSQLLPWAGIEALYERHASNLRAYLTKLLGSGPPDPDDVVQAAFEKVSTVDHLDQIKSPHAFLWRTAQNIVASEFRSASVRDRHAGNVTDVFYSNGGSSLGPERVLLAKKELSAVLRAVEAMPSARRTVLLLHRVEGLSLVEISQRLGLSRSAVYKRLALAMTELHNALNKD